MAGCLFGAGSWHQQETATHQEKAASEPLVRLVWRRFELRLLFQTRNKHAAGTLRAWKENRQAACRKGHNTMRFWGVWVREARTAEMGVRGENGEREGVRVGEAGRAVVFGDGGAAWTVSATPAERRGLRQPAGADRLVEWR